MNNNSDQQLFNRLFREAYRKHFSRELKEPLTEAESKIFCVDIEEKTGLVIGFKSIKNYSLYLTNENTGRKENPSLATLDTLARYVLNAPPTSEQDRKRDEGHYPYWHLYQKGQPVPGKAFVRPVVIVAVIFALALSALLILNVVKKPATFFEDRFDDVSTGALKRNRWHLVNESIPFWNLRGESKGMLRLFTLEGDNWPDTSTTDRSIKNLLVRALNADCFDAEVSFRNFVPRERWQQAGIVILEDTTFAGAMMRISIGFNDFFGGFEKPGEIIVQGVTLQGANRPEEILHHVVFETISTPENLLLNNMKYSGLRIEKRGTKFRFLLANGSIENVAYKEIGMHEFQITPAWIGIFALKGNVDASTVVPVDISGFKIMPQPCGD